MLTASALFLLLSLPGLTKADFVLVSTSIDKPIITQSEYADYATGRALAVKLKKDLVVCKNLKDVSEYQYNAIADGKVFCVTDDKRFKDGATEYVYKDDNLYSKESMDAVAKYEASKTVKEEDMESCSDGSCGVSSSSGFRLFGGSSSSCSSCR